ncbi:hypothetical protein B0H63DRAFT_30223 [Podospora didyma]|uniref:Secreted protein n=1 Tax=Podospora didyma TaxID=330526 RepID=A0AAE0P6J1_9PEZI|nr:hypothetical protein B0H63DRAFT_30223 [Podospora didyma]
MGLAVSPLPLSCAVHHAKVPPCASRPLPVLLFSLFALFARSQVPTGRVASSFIAAPTGLLGRPLLDSCLAALLHCWIEGSDSNLSESSHQSGSLCMLLPLPPSSESHD